jgi:HAE1 family hydrophobic/amphiphilic exporter-1
MQLPELSIKRHVLAWMLSGVIVLFGLIAYQRIGIDRIPSVDFPIIMVNTTLKGANPDVVDTSITGVIESAVNTTPGIDHIQSSSSPGVSTVTITFTLDKNIDVAYNEVQSKVSQVLKKLPENTDPPIIQKVDSNSQAIIWLALTGDRTLQQLNLYAINVLKKKLETINGVGEVTLGGRRDRVIRVHVSPERMASLHLTANDLINAFGREHVQMPGGFLVGDKSEKLIKLDLEYHDVNELQRLIIQNKNGMPIYLKDIADIQDGITDNRQIARYNGKPTVGLGLIKIANANTVKIIDEVQRKLDEELRPSLPPGMSLDISTNDSIFINQLVESLKEHLFTGTLLAALVVFVFLRSLRSTLIIATAIPVSLLGAIAVMYFSGYTFNSMTLLALLLLIGVVVDDAIVVLENIYRHREHLDPNPMSAAINGSKEVTFAVIAASLSLVCIFAPVIFMDGIIGMFFRSFGVVVTFGVLTSLFVSLTLTPMLCSRYLNVTPHHEQIYMRITRWLNRMDTLYQKLLAYSMSHRWKIILLTFAIVIGGGALSLALVNKDFVPETDEASFGITVKTPLGSSLAYTDERMQKIEQIIDRHRPEVASYFATIGAGSRGQVNQGNINVRLVPKTERKISQQDLVKKLKSEFDQVPGVKAIPAAASIAKGQRSEKLQFNITSLNLDELATVAKSIQKELGNVPNMGKVDLDLQLDLPQLEMTIDRDKASALGISATDIASAISVYAGGLDVASYNDVPGDGQRYKVRLKASDDELKQPYDLNRIYLRGNNGNLVRLDTLCQFKSNLGPAVISRLDLQYAANFYINPSMPLGDAVEAVNKISAEKMPAEYKLKFSGQAEEFGKTFKNIKFVFILAMALLYMVLASQFNSFLQPVIIMLAQPLAIIGGLLALLLSGDSLNIYSMIGLVLLIGLVAKNSILLVDLTNQLRNQGKGVDEALLEACPIRLRPVVMTSMTIILALLPAALGFGAGSESNKPLAVAIIGGMVSSTLLTLVVVPAAYSLAIHAQEKWQQTGVRGLLKSLLGKSLHH